MLSSPEIEEIVPIIKRGELSRPKVISVFLYKKLFVTAANSCHSVHQKRLLLYPYVLPPMASNWGMAASLCHFLECPIFQLIQFKPVAIASPVA